MNNRGAPCASEHVAHLLAQGARNAACYQRKCARRLSETGEKAGPAGVCLWMDGMTVGTSTRGVLKDNGADCRRRHRYVIEVTFASADPASLKTRWGCTAGSGLCVSGRRERKQPLTKYREALRRHSRALKEARTRWRNGRHGGGRRGRRRARRRERRRGRQRRRRRGCRRGSRRRGRQRRCRRGCRGRERHCADAGAAFHH